MISNSPNRDAEQYEIFRWSETANPGRSFRLSRGPNWAGRLSALPPAYKVKIWTMTANSQPPNPLPPLPNVVPAAIVPSDFDRLSNILSAARMGRYLKSGGFDHDRAIKMYLWNVALSEAFNLPLRVMEIAVRNQIHRILQQQFGSEWHLATSLKQLITAKAQGNLDEAQTRCMERHNACTIDQIVATLSFGFWTGLLDPDLERPIWRNSLRAAFPNMPGNYQLADLRKKIKNANWFRNRIAHHEPIFEANLTKYFSEVITVVAWINSDLALWVKSNSRVLTIIRSKP